MTKGLSRKLLSMAIDAIRHKAYFLSVQGQMPQWPFPSSAQYPAAYVFGLTSPTDYLTNVEKRRRLRFAVIGFVEAHENLELVKMDCGDEIEEALEDLMSNSTFLSLAVQIKVTGFDPGPTALVELGIVPGVFPPFGAVRYDGEIEYDYDVS